MAEFKLEVPVIGILRGVDADFFSQIMSTAFTCGLQAIEVTMNTAGALGMVAGNRDLVPAGKFLGMGTICNVEEAKKAVSAGAMFLVSPNYDAQVIDYANQQNVPVISGALTPSEVYSAWSRGAAMVKVFPCQALGGSRYIKDLRGPFDDIPLVAVGGVTLENFSDYLKSGASAVGVSTSLFGKTALAERNIEILGGNVTAFIDIYRKFKRET